MSSRSRDPVEFVHSPIKAQITHREGGPDAGSFASAIRSAGREDADVILIGELRTNETMKLALQLASFGVLVFGTVRTNSAAATSTASSTRFPPTNSSRSAACSPRASPRSSPSSCSTTKDGTSRVAAHEISSARGALSAMIREGKTFQITNLMQAGRSAGMQTMDMALERLVKKDTISVQAALEKAIDKDSFQKLFPDAQGVTQNRAAEGRESESLDRFPGRPGAQSRYDATPLLLSRPPEADDGATFRGRSTVKQAPLPFSLDTWSVPRAPGRSRSRCRARARARRQDLDEDRPLEPA